MMRVSVATAVTAVLALVVLLLPRSFIGSILGGLRPDVAPVMSAPVSVTTTLEAAYPAALFDEARNRVTAPIYAFGVGPYRYDFAIAQGSGRGIADGNVAVLPDVGVHPTPTLVGVVHSVSATHATVETLTNPAWRTAVRIGTSSVDALMVGGLTPTLTLIPKGSAVAVGDVVISTDEHLPYGLFVGTVSEIRDTADGVLREATIALPYSLSGLRAVDIVPSN